MALAGGVGFSLDLSYVDFSGPIVQLFVLFALLWRSLAADFGTSDSKILGLAEMCSGGWFYFLRNKVFGKYFFSSSCVICCLPVSGFDCNHIFGSLGPISFVWAVLGC
jgi:hypothetical protein